MLHKVTTEFKDKSMARTMWAILFVSVLANVHTEHWANRVYADYNGYPFTYGDMQWYVCFFSILAILIGAIDSRFDLIVSKLCFALVLGKIADLFSCPFYFGANEFIFDVMMGCTGLIMWLMRNHIRERIVTFVIAWVYSKDRAAKRYGKMEHDN